jgi:hypothetical protein
MLDIDVLRIPGLFAVQPVARGIDRLHRILALCPGEQTEHHGTDHAGDAAGDGGFAD